MGRTNPTYRDRLRQIESEYEPFRKALRKQYVDHFDQLFDHGRQFADAGGYQNAMDTMEPFLLSIVLAQEKRISELEAGVEELESEM